MQCIRCMRVECTNRAGDLHGCALCSAWRQIEGDAGRAHPQMIDLRGGRKRGKQGWRSSCARP